MAMADITKELKTLRRRVAEFEAIESERKQSEKQVRESEENLKTYFENAPDGIYLSDFKGVFLYGNKKAEEILGYKREELIGNNFLKLKLLTGKYLVKAGQLLALNLIGGNTGPDEFELVRKDKSVCWVEINTSPIKQKDKRIVIGFVRDITDRKKAEKLLYENEVKYRLIVEKSQDVLFTFNIAGELLYVSPSVKNILGYNPSDLIGRTFGSLVHPEDIPGLQQAIQQNIKNGSQTPGGNRYRVRNASGEWRWHNAAGNAVYDENGKFLSFVAIARDVTEHKRTEETLKESETRYRELVNTITSGVFIYKGVDNGEDFIIADVSGIAEKMEGINRNDVIGKKITEVLPEVKNYAWFNVLQKVWQTGNSEYFSSNVHKDTNGLGKTRDNWVYKLPSGEIVNVYNDVTDKKRAEEALKTSGKNLRNSMDSSPIGIRIVDKERQTLYANQAYLDIFGYANFDEEKSNPPEEQYTPESYGDWVFRNEKLLRGEPVPDKVEVSITHKDGAIRYLQLSRREVIWDDKPQYQTLYHDITDLKQAEEAQLESEKKCQVIVENSRDLVFTLNVPGEFVYVSPSAQGLLGYTAADLIGKSFLSLVHQEDVHVIDEEIERATKGGYQISRDNEFRIRHASGEWRWVISKGTRVVDINGNFLCFTGVIRDITERKQAEEALKASEEKYSILVEQSTDGIVILIDRVVEFANHKMNMMTGYSEDEIIGKYIYELTAPECKQLLNEIYERGRAGQEGTDNLELEILTKDKKRIAVETTAQHIVYQGKPAGMIIIRDIT